IKDEKVSEVVDTEELEVIVADTIIVGTEVDPEIIVEVKREIEATIMMVEVIIMDQDQRLAHMIVTKEKKVRQGKQDSNRNFNDGGYENDQRDLTFNCLSSVCFLAKKTNDWYADSGATHHMTDQRHFFNTFKPVKPGTWHVYGIGSIKMEVHGVGNIEIHSYVQGEKNVG
ncbi:putative Copia protein (Gag-int-pol protein), partial [Daphnia magna]